MAKKYQIFVSSTFRDLVDERQDAIRSILDLGHIPAGMELFPAADTQQLEYIKKIIDECDYYVLIIGGRYGSLDAEGVSFTEREYDYAVETGKIVLAFVHGDFQNIPFGKVDSAKNLSENLANFRAKVMQGRLVKEWHSRENLDSLVTKAVARATNEYPAQGWIRGDAAASEDLLQNLNDLRNENDSLKRKLKLIASQNAPKLDNLAGLDDTIELKFSRTINYRGSTRIHYDREKFQWLEIFVAVGINILVPKTTSSIGLLLYKRLQDRNPSVDYKSLTDEDTAVVKYQLVGLGLIRAYVSQTTKGDMREFMQLTEFGKKTLAEHLAVKKSSSTGDSVQTGPDDTNQS